MPKEHCTKAPYACQLAQNTPSASAQLLSWWGDRRQATKRGQTEIWRVSKIANPAQLLTSSGPVYSEEGCSINYPGTIKRHRPKAAAAWHTTPHHRRDPIPPPIIHKTASSSVGVVLVPSLGHQRFGKTSSHSHSRCAPVGRPVAMSHQRPSRKAMTDRCRSCLLGICYTESCLGAKLVLLLAAAPLCSRQGIKSSTFSIRFSRTTQ